MAEAKRNGPEFAADAVVAACQRSDRDDFPFCLADATELLAFKQLPEEAVSVEECRRELIEAFAKVLPPSGAKVDGGG